mmetsp:Transcript_32231/g.51692  ORF Transcript_32231/g.51692 Transcript_32231/m.51692 type:complete len:94 (+) Transcript_32231:392-673(+)
MDQARNRRPRTENPSVAELLQRSPLIQNLKKKMKNAKRHGMTSVTAPIIENITAMPIGDQVANINSLPSLPQLQQYNGAESAEIRQSSQHLQR